MSADTPQPSDTGHNRHPVLTEHVRDQWVDRICNRQHGIAPWDLEPAFEEAVSIDTPNSRDQARLHPPSDSVLIYKRDWRQGPPILITVLHAAPIPLGDDHLVRCQTCDLRYDRARDDECPWCEGDAPCEGQAPRTPYNQSDMDDGEDTTGAFDRCPDCGEIAVSLPRHTCSSGDRGYIPREEREHLAHADDRDAGREVLLPAGTASTRYHEIDRVEDTAEPEARCWAGPDPEDGTTRTQREAAERGYAPCGACRVVANAETDEQPT